MKRDIKRAITVKGETGKVEVEIPQQVGLSVWRESYKILRSQGIGHWT